jgi:hypothetical protein
MSPAPQHPASTWDQGAFVEIGGWGVIPGSKTPDSGVRRACAVLLSNLK